MISDFLRFIRASNSNDIVLSKGKMKKGPIRLACVQTPVACWPGGKVGQLPPLRVKYEGRQNDNLKTWAPKVPFFSANQIVSKFSPRILLQT